MVKCKDCKYYDAKDFFCVNEHFIFNDARYHHAENKADDCLRQESMDDEWGMCTVGENFGCIHGEIKEGEE